MTALAWLIPIALLLGGLGLAGFLWSLKSGQFEDLEGAGWRALEDEGGIKKPEAVSSLSTAGTSADTRGELSSRRSA